MRCRTHEQSGVPSSLNRGRLFRRSRVFTAARLFLASNGRFRHSSSSKLTEVWSLGTRSPWVRRVKSSPGVPSGPAANQDKGTLTIDEQICEHLISSWSLVRDTGNSQHWKSLDSWEAIEWVQILNDEVPLIRRGNPISVYPESDEFSTRELNLNLSRDLTTWKSPTL